MPLFAVTPKVYCYFDANLFFNSDWNNKCILRVYLLMEINILGPFVYIYRLTRHNIEQFPHLILINSRTSDHRQLIDSVLLEKRRWVSRTTVVHGRSIRRILWCGMVWIFVVTVSKIVRRSLGFRKFRFEFPLALFVSLSRIGKPT